MYGREVARNQGGQLVIQKTDGEIRNNRSYYLQPVS